MAEYDLPVLYIGIKARLPVRRLDGTTCPVLPDGTPCINNPHDQMRYFYGMLMSKRAPVIVAMRVGSPDTDSDSPLSTIEAKLIDTKKLDFTEWAQQHKLKFNPDNLKIYAGLE
jgi:hypothetical protein